MDRSAEQAHPLALTFLLFLSCYSSPPGRLEIEDQPIRQATGDPITDRIRALGAFELEVILKFMRGGSGRVRNRQTAG